MRRQSASNGIVSESVQCQRQGNDCFHWQAVCCASFGNGAQSVLAGRRHKRLFRVCSRTVAWKAHLFPIFSCFCPLWQHSPPCRVQLPSRAARNSDRFLPSPSVSSGETVRTTASPSSPNAACQTSPTAACSTSSPNAGSGTGAANGTG